MNDQCLGTANNAATGGIPTTLVTMMVTRVHSKHREAALEVRRKQILYTMQHVCQEGATTVITRVPTHLHAVIAIIANKQPKKPLSLAHACR